MLKNTNQPLAEASNEEIVKQAKAIASQQLEYWGIEGCCEANEPSVNVPYMRLCEWKIDYYQKALDKFEEHKLAVIIRSYTCNSCYPTQIYPCPNILELSKEIIGEQDEQ